MTDPNAPENGQNAAAPGAEQQNPYAAPGAEQQNPYAAPGAEQQQAGQQNPYAAPAAGAGYGAVPPAQPPRKKTWLWWVIGGAGALVVLIIAAVIFLVIAVNSGNGAKNVAQDYVAAIAKGDAKAANTLARANADDTDNKLLTNDVLSKAKRITDAKVTRTSSSRSSDLTYAQVTYKLDGSTFRTVIEVDKDSKGWFVDRGLTTRVPYLDGVTEYGLKGSNVSINSDAADLVAYPGVYTVVSPSGLFEFSGDTQVRIAPSSNPSNKITVKPSKKYLDEVTSAVKKHVDDCLAKTTAYNDIYDCGIDLDYPENMMTSNATAKVTVTEYPKAKASEKSGRDVTIEGGSATAALTGTDFRGNAASQTVNGTFKYLSGSIKVVNGKVEVKFY